jgi:outer membrane receptor for ferrienterochelin and colicins
VIPRALAVLLLLAAAPLPALGQVPPDTLRIVIERGVARIDTLAAPRDSTIRHDYPEVVVSATRTARALENVPVPTTILAREAIAEQGAIRLSDLLAEQPGLVTVEGLGGTGLQLQGFDADYTLVLFDGEPVIGRTAGILDLDRLAVTGVDRVEVVRGPLSARFGADALAGVVNLIPRRPGESPGGRIAARLESHGLNDLAAEAETGTEQWGVRIHLNRFASDGVAFGEAPGTLVLPAFADYSADLRARYRHGESTELDLTARLGTQSQEGTALFGTLLYDEEANRTDWSIRPVLRHRISPNLRAEASLYASRFTNDWFAIARESGLTFEDGASTHDYRKAEAGITWLPTASIILHAGGGAIRETIAGERYADTHASTQPYAYAEAEWLPHPALDVVVSGRFDAPSDYAARFTPRAAVLVRPADRVRLRASIGSGYRAPDFRQRYLAFTNPAGGYALFGAEEARERLAVLDAQGSIRDFLIDPEQLGPLSAEASTAFGAGIEADLPAGASVRVNAFHNEVRDLIDTQVVATRTNGQQIFSYFNLDRIYTRGIEADLRWQTSLPLGTGTLAAQIGYQLLDTADRDVLDAIDEGSLFRRTPDGRDVRVTRSDYGGLFGRSRHSGSLRLTHRLEGVTTTARIIWRSRYGFADRNSSGVLDDDREYAPGYALVNLTASRAFGRADLSIGVRNLLSHTDTLHLPSQHGRVVFAGAGWRF